jgi:UDP-N-acetylglucosamine--N-acetylmuramyl-(pentapeptide) pyrophosphoryl-undecaprenol N-acetylglucosamine transferase
MPLHFISIGGLRGKGFKTAMTAPFHIARAIQQSIVLLKKVDPDAVIGMGGFVSGPGGVASWSMRCPLIIHEQNAKAGFTNKLLARFSKRTLEGFPQAFQPSSKVITIGNPIRHEIEMLPSPQDRVRGPRMRLLVLGGSLGAQALNDVVPRALAKLGPAERPEILHQTGEKHFAATQQFYGSMGLKATLAPFIQEMAHAYSWADMVLCRAGALTVAELCAAGLGAILVPFPFATDDHQTANARFMVDNKAGLCIQQAALTEAGLAEVLKQFSQSPERRIAMGQAAYQLRKVNVAEKFYEILCEAVLQST